MKVAVTGGSGVVGSAVVRHLVASGEQVRALARSANSAEKLRELGATPMLGDTLDGDALNALVDGCQRIFHIAGVNEMCSKDPAHMWAVNVNGTLAALAASTLAGVERFIHTSSAATIGEAQGTVGTEWSEHRGWYLSEYERSKAMAERLLFESTGDIEVVAVNPSSVQGPGRASGTGALLLAAAQGRAPILVDTRFSIVDIDDCARGHLLAAERGAPGERYLLSGGSLTVRSAVRQVNRLLGRPRSPWFVRPGLLTGVATVVDGTSRLLGRRSPLCPESARVLLHGHLYDGSRATRDLGLDYRSATDTLARAVQWFVAEGLVDKG